MTLPPMVERELRVAARRPATHKVRFFAALGVLSLWLLLMVMGRSTPASTLGPLLFGVIGGAAFGFALLAGVFFTADCLSEERREETLGLLFLTDLRGYDVVLGKLAATSLQAAYGLLAVLPLLGLPVLMGGVSGAAFGRMILVLLVTLFLSLSVGLMVSALSREARQAMAGTFGTMLAISAFFPVLYWVLTLIPRVGRFPPLLIPSPVFAFFLSFEGASGSGPRWLAFWLSLGLIAGFAVVSLGLAACLLPRTWARVPRARPTPLSPPGPAVSARRTRLAREARAARSWQPALWLALRKPGDGRGAGRLPAVVFVLWAAFFVAAACGGRAGGDAFGWAMLAAFSLHLLVKSLLALEATRLLCQAIQSGALELLLTTPLPEHEIVAGQLRAAMRKFGWWWGMLAVVNLAMTGLVNLPRLPMGPIDRAVFTGLFLGGIVGALADLAAIVLVGMRQALRTGRHHRATFGTLGRVLVPGWGAMVVLFFLSRTQFFRRPEMIELAFGLWLVFGLAVDVVMGGRAYASLRRGFRGILLAAKA